MHNFTKQFDFSIWCLHSTMTNIHQRAVKLDAAGCLCEGEDEDTSCHGNSSMCWTGEQLEAGNLLSAMRHWLVH